MTIAFPKFPSKKRQNRPDPTMTAPYPPTATLPNTGTNTGDLPTESFNQAGLAQTQKIPHAFEPLTPADRFTAPKPSLKPRKNKWLPALAAILGLAAIAAIAYPMYQSMLEEKTASPLPAPAITKTANPVKPIPASSIASTNSAQSTNANSPTPVVNPAPATPSDTVKPATTSTQDDNLQKPLLVDTTPASVPKASPTNNSANPNNETISKAKPDSMAPAPTTTINAQPKPTGNKTGMSYDEFVKTSESAVYIEAPTKHK